MRRRLIVLAVVGVVIGLVPMAAGAQTVEEKADALVAFEAAVDGLAGVEEGRGGETLQEWIDGLAAFEEALEILEAVYGDEFDYPDVKLKADEFQDAIDGEGLGHEAPIRAAGAALIGAAEALAAEAAAAEGGDGTEEPTGVATGAR